MADWTRIFSRGRVEDRRAIGPSAIGGGLGIGGIAIVLLLNYLATGEIRVTDVLSQLDQGLVQTSNTQEFEGLDSYEVFASTVLGSSNDLWSRVFAQQNAVYQEPRLVLFRGATESACGAADGRVGPHYCPYDGTIYLDETFFDELKALGGEGDVAQAYVIAHEVGHHVQNLLGLLETDSTQEASIATELQADCFAGIWAYSIRDVGVLLPGEIKEAMDAAAAVGDDRIQATYTGRISPESWTHGSSEDRVAAFNRGYESGSMAACQF